MHLGYDFPDFQQGSRALVNTSISLGDSGDRWKASVFVRNLTDKNYVITIPQTTFGVAPYSLSQYPLYEARRIIGGSFEVHF
jgi:outer membrane receptor protein involved in Fe transport